MATTTTRRPVEVAGDPAGDSAGDAAVDPVGAIFASRSVPVHLARGIAGLVLLVTALALVHTSALWLLLVPVTVVLWRGCVSCWTLGLIATRARTCPIR